MSSRSMTGAECLARTLVAAGVRVCFANPGTSEMHFVAALDTVEGLRPVLCLFEGVATGMADGFARMSGVPAATLLHLGTGLANGLANLHNARRAASPLLNLVGEHARAHLNSSSPFIADIAGIARPLSDFVHTAESALTLAADGARAVAAARTPPGAIATLIVPADVAWGGAEGPAEPLEPSRSATVPQERLDEVARALESGRRSALLLRGAALCEPALTSAGRIAARVGARLLCETLTPRMQRGAGRVPIERIPYTAEEGRAFFTRIEQVVLVGAEPPAAAFAYPDKPSALLPPGSPVVYLAHPHEDAARALAALAELLRAPRAAAPRTALALPEAPRGALDALAIGRIVARHLPEGAILCDESATGSTATVSATASAAPHDYLGNTGGSLGMGLPLAGGAALGAPERKVVCVQADGAACYTPQALWTQARERLDVTTVIYANRSYAILKWERARLEPTAGPGSDALMSLVSPPLDWCRLAQGMGVEASRAHNAEELEAQFGDAMRRHGPRLIEALL